MNLNYKIKRVVVELKAREPQLLKKRTLQREIEIMQSKRDIKHSLKCKFYFDHSGLEGCPTVPCTISGLSQDYLHYCVGIVQGLPPKPLNLTLNTKL